MVNPGPAYYAQDIPVRPKALRQWIFLAARVRAAIGFFKRWASSKITVLRASEMARLRKGSRPRQVFYHVNMVSQCLIGRDDFIATSAPLRQLEYHTYIVLASVEASHKLLFRRSQQDGVFKVAPLPPISITSAAGVSRTVSSSRAHYQFSEVRKQCILLTLSTSDAGTMIRAVGHLRGSSGPSRRKSSLRLFSSATVPVFPMIAESFMELDQYLCH